MVRTELYLYLGKLETSFMNFRILMNVFIIFLLFFFDALLEENSEGKIDVRKWCKKLGFCIVLWCAFYYLKYPLIPLEYRFAKNNLYSCYPWSVKGQEIFARWCIADDRKMAQDARGISASWILGALWDALSFIWCASTFISFSCLTVHQTFVHHVSQNGDQAESAAI